jgi:PAS domain S-box-containing protein
MNLATDSARPVVFLENLLDREPVTVPPDTPIAAVLPRMGGGKPVLIVAGDRLRGIFTPREALSLLTTSADITTVAIAAVMNDRPPILTLSTPSIPVTELTRYRENGITDLPVLNERGKLLGILDTRTIGEIFHSVAGELQYRLREEDFQRRENAERERILEESVIQRTRDLQSALEQVEYYARRCQLALEGARVGLWDWDMTGDRVYWSMYHELIFGYEVGKPERTYEEWRARVHPGDIDRVEAEIAEARDRGTDYHCEYRVVWPDGSIHWVEGVGRFYYDDGKEPVRGVGVIYEIDDRKRAESDLARSQQRLRTLFDANAIGILYGDVHGAIKEANDEFLRIVGYGREDLHNGRLDWINLTPEEYLPLDKERVQEAIDRGACTPYEKEYIRADGTRVSVFLGYGLVGEEREESVAFILDLSERKRAEHQLRQQAETLRELNTALTDSTRLLARRNEELDRFAYVVSHDLKAPLRAIGNLSEWLEEDLGEVLGDETRRHMDLLRQRVYRLNALIDGLLSYSRVGRIDVSEGKVNVERLIAEVIDSLAPPSTFTVAIVPPLPTLLTKPVLLTQVFANLIGNAIKHHDRPDGRIQISCSHRGGFYEFRVSDDGPGISPRYHGKIFDIFQVLQPRDRVENTGIGLSIVKKIIEGEGGQISIESDEGRGATFIFTWPDGEGAVEE